MTRVALTTTSQRFATLQQLINAIRRAGDQKAVLDLQARMAGESAMLQNEQSKLTTLFQLVEAEGAPISSGCTSWPCWVRGSLRLAFSRCPKEESIWVSL